MESYSGKFRNLGARYSGGSSEDRTSECDVTPRGYTHRITSSPQSVRDGRVHKQTLVQGSGVTIHHQELTADCWSAN